MSDFKTILKIIAIVFLAIFQVIGLRYLAINGFWPDLILIFGIILVCLDKTQDGFLVGAIGGLVLDIASPTFFGFNLLIILLIIFLVKFLVGKFLSEPNGLMIILITVIATLFSNIFKAIIFHQLSFVSILTSIFSAAILTIIIYQTIKVFSGRRIIARTNRL